MVDHDHLHDAEVLLCRMRPSGALLVARCLCGLLDSLFAAIVLYAVIGGGLWAVTGEFPSIWWFVVLYAFCVLILFIIKYRQWSHSSFRVTTERILLEYPSGFIGIFHRTIKWPQYQESFAGHRGPLSLFWRAKPLCIRFGNADGEQTACFPSLRLADDLKHYLDKADSLIRKGQASEIRPFIEKPKGQRD